MCAPLFRPTVRPTGRTGSRRERRCRCTQAGAIRRSDTTHALCALLCVRAMCRVCASTRMGVRPATVACRARPGQLSESMRVRVRVHHGHQQSTKLQAWNMNICIEDKHSWVGVIDSALLVASTCTPDRASWARALGCSLLECTLVRWVGWTIRLRTLRHTPPLQCQSECRPAVLSWSAPHRRRPPCRRSRRRPTLLCRPATRCAVVKSWWLHG